MPEQQRDEGLLQNLWQSAKWWFGGEVPRTKLPGVAGRTFEAAEHELTDRPTPGTEGMPELEDADIWDHGSLRALKTSVEQAEAIETKMRGYYKKVLDNYRQNPDYHRYTDDGQLIEPTMADVGRMLGDKQIEVGNRDAGYLLKQVGLAGERRRRRDNARAEQQAFDEMGTKEKVATVASDLAMTYGNMYTFGTLDWLAENFGAPVADVLGLAPGDTSGEGRKGDRTYAGSEGYRRARQQMGEDMGKLGRLTIGDIDTGINAGRAMQNMANLLGFMRGSGALRSRSMVKLASMADKAGKGSALSKAGLMFVTGMKPKTAAHLLKVEQLGSRGQQLLKATQRSAKFTEKAGRFGAEALQSAANFGAYEGLYQLNGTMQAAMDAYRGDYTRMAEMLGLDDEEWRQLQESGGGLNVSIPLYLRALPKAGVAWANGALAGATMPLLQRLGDAFAKGLRGGYSGFGRRKTVGAYISDLFKQRGAVGTARTMANQLGAAMAGGAIEFMGFGLLPHWDGGNQLHVQTLTDLFSGDPKRAGNAWKGIMGHMLNGALLKGARVLKGMRRGELPSTMEGTRADWLDYNVWGEGKLPNVPLLPAPDPLNRETAAERKVIEEMIRSGKKYPAATEADIQELVKMAADLFDAAPENVREQLIFELMHLVAADSMLKERLNPEAFLGNLVAEVRARQAEKFELENIAKGAEVRLPEAIDRLVDAESMMLKGMESASPEVRAIAEEIDRLVTLRDAVKEALDEPRKMELEAQIAELERRMQETLPFSEPGMRDQAYGDAVKAVVDAAYEQVKERMGELQKAKAEVKKRARAEDDAKALGIDAENVKEAERLFPDKATPKKDKDKDKDKGEGEGGTTPAKPKPTKPAGPTAKQKARAERKARLEKAKAEALAKRQSAEERADEAQAALLDAEGEASTASIAQLFQDRAEQYENNPSAAAPYLKAAELLQRYSQDFIRKVLRDQGQQGLRDRGFSKKTARLVQVLMKIAPPKAVPPGLKPGAGGGKSKGKPPVVETAGAKITKLFKLAGYTVEPDTAERLARSFDGLTIEEAIDKLRGMGIKDKDIDDMLPTLGKIARLAVTQGPVDTSLVAEAGIPATLPDGEEVTVYHAGKLEGSTITGAEGQLHVGTLAAAQYVQKKTGKRAPHIFKATLRIRNPIEMTDSGRGHGAGEIAEDLMAANPTMDPKLKELLQQVVHLYKLDKMTEAANRLVAGLKKFGYDAIKYVNINEDKGSISWILLDPDISKFEKYEPTPIKPEEVVPDASEPTAPTPTSTVPVEQADRIAKAIENQQKHDDMVEAEADPAQRAGQARQAARVVQAAAQAAARGSPTRVRLERKAAELRRIARWYDQRAKARRAAEEAAELDESASTDDKGDRDDAPDYTAGGIARKEMDEARLRYFQRRSSEDVINELEAHIEDYPELKGNLALIRAGAKKQREFESNTITGESNVPVDEGGFGDRIVVRTPYGVFGGIVVTKPEWLTKGGPTSRRVTLWDGKGTRRVRLSDIEEWASETNADLDFSKGVGTGGIVRNGAEVTNAQMQRLLSPANVGKVVEPMPKPKLAKQRHSILLSFEEERHEVADVSPTRSEARTAELIHELISLAGGVNTRGYIYKLAEQYPGITPKELADMLLPLDKAGHITLFRADKPPDTHTAAEKKWVIRTPAGDPRHYFYVDSLAKAWADKISEGRVSAPPPTPKKSSFSEADLRAQAIQRAKRQRVTDLADYGRLSPEDFRLEALAFLVHPDDRRTYYIPMQIGGSQEARTKAEGAQGAAVSMLAAAKNLQEKGKKLPPRFQRALAAATEFQLAAVSQYAQHYFDPQTARMRTEADLRKAAEAGDEAARKDLRQYETQILRATEADQHRRNMMPWKDRKNDGPIIISLGENTTNDKAMLQRRIWHEASGQWRKQKGRPEFLFAQWQSDNGTWHIVEVPTKAAAWELIKEHFDPRDAKNATTWATGRRGIVREQSLQDGRVIIDIKDRTMLLNRAMTEGMDLLMRFGVGEDLTKDSLVVYDQDGNPEAAVDVGDSLGYLRRIFGKRFMRPLEKWLEENPRPDPADLAARAQWEMAWKARLLQGKDSPGWMMQERVDRGEDPITGRKMVHNENGEWVIDTRKNLDDGPGTVVTSIGGMVPIGKRTARNLIRGTGLVSDVLYAPLQGFAADMPTSVVSTLMTQPLAKLNRAVLGIAGMGPTKADTVFGWSPAADYIASRHNEHMAAIDLWTARADKMARKLAKKYKPEQLRQIVRAEHEGKKPPQLDEFRALMQRAAQEAKDVGLASSKFDDKWAERYVRMGRWKWTDPERLRRAYQDARVRVIELTEELKAAKAILDAKDDVPTDAEVDRLARLQMKTVAQQKRQRALEKQWKRSLRKLHPWGGFHDVRPEPLDIVDVRAAERWEDSDRRRRIEDWDVALKKGLDDDRPELLLWDSIVHHFHAIEQARWIKRISEDPRMSLPTRDAPSDWVVMTPTELRSRRVYKHLAGRAINPWVHHFMKLQEGPNGPVERMMRDVHAAAKMALTALAPANWVLQVFANPLMTAVKSGTSVWRAYPAYLKALFDILNPLSRRRMEREFGKLRWLDVATDWDREYIQKLMEMNPTMNADSVFRTLMHGAEQIYKGEWGKGIKGLAKGSLVLPQERTLQALSFVYRRLDAAGRISTYRLLKDQGFSHEQAVQKTNRGWDLFHQNKFGDFLRKGVLQIPGTKVSIPLPFMANSFASVPMTFLRNFAEIVGKTPLQLAELATWVSLWNGAVANMNGMTDEEVENILNNVQHNENDLTWWIRKKTTPLMPWGTQSLDFWGYHPIGAALDAVPGGASAFWGAAEGLKNDGPMGALKGALTGRDAYGTTAPQSLLHRALGGNHIILSPWADYTLDRDAKGRAVQYRYEGKGLWGSRGKLRLALEEGVLPLAAVYGLGRLGGASPGSATAMGAAASMVAQVLSEIDATDAGKHPSFEIISDGEDIFEVKPRSWEDVVMRRLAGLKVRNPDAFRRALEKLARDKSIEIDDFSGKFKAAEGLEGTALYDARRLAAKGNDLKEGRRGLFLWGMARHLTTLPVGSDKWTNVRDEIVRRYSSVESRRRATAALVRIEMGQEAAQTDRILASVGLLTPSERELPVPPPTPAETRDLLRGE